MLVATDICRRVSGDRSIGPALPCPTLRIGANDDGCVVVDDDSPVSQSLRLCRINIAADYRSNEGFFVLWFRRTKTGDELVIKNTSKGSRVVVVLSGNP